MKILRFVAQVWRERARSIAFSGTVSFFAWPLCALAVSIAQLHSHTLTVLLSSILAGVTGALASFARERHLANLEVQFRNVEELKPVNWDVVVNGVKTGEVSNADYAAIQYEVYASNWLWLQQAVSILKAVWRSATSTVSALPFALTWALVLGTLEVLIGCRQLHQHGASKSSNSGWDTGGVTSIPRGANTPRWGVFASQFLFRSKYMSSTTTMRFRTAQWERVRVAHLRVAPDFARHLRQIASPVQICYQQLMQAYKGEPVGIECRSIHRAAWAFVAPEMSGSEPWRIQRFDEDGFVGHTCHNSLEDAVESLLEEGFRVPDPGALDRVGASERWARGVRLAAVRQRFQEGLITFQQMLEEAAALQEVA